MLREQLGMTLLRLGCGENLWEESLGAAGRLEWARRRLRHTAVAFFTSFSRQRTFAYRYN